MEQVMPLLIPFMRKIKHKLSQGTALESDTAESRREWMLRLMKHAGGKNERNKDFQFWQQHNHPI